MIEVLKFLVSILAALVIAWVIGGFISWEFNPAEWERNSRILAIAFALMFAGLTS